MVSILLPVFAEVALTFILLFWSGYLRVTAVSRKETHIRDIALRQPAWPLQVQKVSNAFDNQLQLPVLFYVLVILAIFTGKTSLVLLVLAWLFVASRIGHAVIHVTHNHVPTRFRWFAAGTIILAVMWVLFAVQLLLDL
jgi:hypothetical protein